MHHTDFLKSLQTISEAYLLFKFEEMSIKMLLEPLICIIYTKLFKTIFLKQEKE